jgi:DNA polymerase I-like protein with 3'-5' exonuclease and polymerase domains
MAKVTNFSLIYGDYYVAIAKKLWRSAESATHNGIPVHEYLKTKNIRSLGTEQNMSPDTFTHHMKGVCDRFWSERFPVFAKWRTDTWDSYQRNGCLYTKTGFRIHGVYKRNEILNVETQGCAFHCLLKSVIEITKEILKRRMGARLICQIHDSILAEVPRQEVDDYVQMADATMTHQLMGQWPWIILPLKTEVEVGEDSWASKKAYYKAG